MVWGGTGSDVMELDGLVRDDIRWLVRDHR